MINTRMKAGMLATLVAGATLMTGCQMMPQGPSVAVMPAPGKPFDLFQQEDQQCRNFAAQQVAPAVQAANAQSVGTAVVGTALGAAVGGLAGGWRAPQHGAAIGLAGGSVVGLGMAQSSANGNQRRYDIAYQQCMYANGNQLPPAPPPPRPVYVERSYYYGP